MIGVGADPMAPETLQRTTNKPVAVKRFYLKYYALGSDKYTFIKNKEDGLF